MINGQELETRDGFDLGCKFWISKQLQKRFLLMEIDATLSKKIELDYNAQKLILKLKYGNVLEKISLDT
jgi:hypothetical protein